ncbi:lipoprotein signal peptidase [Runella slithyformis]|uniref:Lipoprotein signal peptidase n=1 Tax=Runella slithyformis (strain ATCC 29530 / DSM 19594 / LMG 11500 / NCIMB 11436 / LSU 4) TaxID=761193 RepID=A0A7U3ZJG3_RUNSL|nr:lipoprotein signal peptidase [Runella slithyformis]AEI48351.1 Lipoprotein signal peptidase [Runella slithyformis DSM 19594]
MTQSPKGPFKYFLFALLLIGIDQASKLLVHHYMSPGFAGQIRLIGDWFKLYYVTNPGMAFGMQIDHEYGKLFLTVFRLGAMVFIAGYMLRLAYKGASGGLLWAMSMILAGAIGNLIDSIFYGVLIDNAPYGSPTPWFHGQVIDMVFIDFWEGFVPDWVPVWGGQYYTTPIFNFADACIFIGVCIILMFQGTFFPRPEETEETDHRQVPEPETPQLETTENEPVAEAEYNSEAESFTSDPVTEKEEITSLPTEEEEAPEPSLEVPPTNEDSGKYKEQG